MNAAWAEKKRPEAKQESIKSREIWCSSTVAIDDQELLLHEEAVSDDGPRATRSQALGDCG